jgi:ElaB/YqjD/DUF883 family membrane-anchored ribosome-binding protein
MDLRAQGQEDGWATSGNSGGISAQPASVLSTAASTVHDVLEKAENAAGPAAERVKPVVSRLPQSAQAPIYDAVHSAAAAAATLPAQAEGFVRRQQQRLEPAAQYVQQKPLQAVAIAFTAGWLIGRITR